jgi:acid stress chaperone HdeB
VLLVVSVQAYGGDRESFAAFSQHFIRVTQVTAAQAQVTVDVSKITCDQLLMEKPVPAKYVVLWLSGYYNGKRNTTIIEPEAMDKNEQKVDFYCDYHREMTVMDAVKNVLGLDK